MQDSNNENTLPTRASRDIEDTAPTRAQTGSVDTTPTEVTLPYPASPKKTRGPRRWPWILLGLLLIFLFGGAGTWMGYRSAIQLRKDKDERNRVTLATEHFMLGMQAQGEKKLSIARQQFEYVIRLDPNFPGAQDKLREVMVAMAIKDTPTPVPTVALPTLTPTVDTRPQEEIFNTAKQQFEAKDWNNLFATIDSLRRVDPKYHAVEIDDMLYVALRYRGIDKIVMQANLEGGLYDLALAEQYGPLDVDALNYRNWARLYLNGATFWEVDWLKVINAFEQIYPAVPNLRDGSGYTAIDRYRIAASKYADQLMSKGDACGAYDYYKKSLNAVNDGNIQKTATAAYETCHPPTATPVPFTPTVPVPPTQAAQPTQAETAPVPPAQPSPTTETVKPTETTPPAPPAPPAAAATQTPTPKK